MPVASATALRPSANALARTIVLGSTLFIAARGVRLATGKRASVIETAL